ALPRPVARTPMMFQYELLERAKQRRRRIVLPEGEDERVLRAADILLRRGGVELVILGNEADVRGRAAGWGLALEQAEVIDPLSSPKRAEYARSEEHTSELQSPYDLV